MMKKIIGQCRSQEAEGIIGKIQWVLEFIVCLSWGRDAVASNAAVVSLTERLTVATLRDYAIVLVFMKISTQSNTYILVVHVFACYCFLVRL
jgi:hypothetical protein